MDLIATADRIPQPGESITGGAFSMSPGGKCGNQACQFALSGARAYALTRLGDDQFGRQILAALQAKGVDTSMISIDPDLPTGASTVLAARGEYASIIAPGAGAHLWVDAIEQARTRIENADALVVQLELPAAISATAAGISAAAGRTVVLNASPAPAALSDVPQSLWDAASVLIVNRVETARLLGREFQFARVDAALTDLSAALGIEIIVTTMGPDGAAAFSEGKVVHQLAYPTSMADAVGAGDAFLGAFCNSLLEGLTTAASLRRGAAAGALAVCRPGAYDALPSRTEIDAFLARRPYVAVSRLTWSLPEAPQLRSSLASTGQFRHESRK